MANSLIAAETDEADAGDTSTPAEPHTKQATPRLRLAERSKASKSAVKSGTAASKVTKAEEVLKKLKSQKGVTIDALMEVTGWQAHSVRAFLSGTVKKKLGLSLASEIGKDGARRYRVTSNVAAE